MVTDKDDGLNWVDYDRLREKIGVDICNTNPLVSCAFDQIRDGEPVEDVLTMLIAALATAQTLAEDKLLILKLSASP